MSWSEIENAIPDKIKGLVSQKKLENKRIYLFGCNIYTERINNLLYMEGYQLHGIIDNDENKQGKSFCNILIYALEEIDMNGAAEEDIVVLIASRYEKDMTKQIRQIYQKAEVISLFDIEKAEKAIEMEGKFWTEENYKRNLKSIKQGADIYNRLKHNGNLIVFPIPSLGDIFVSLLYFHEYEKKTGLHNFEFVVASKGTYKTAKLFGVKKIALVSKEEMSGLVKYIIFRGRDNKDMICSWGNAFWCMATYKKIPFAHYGAKYFLKLPDGCEPQFPSIKDDQLTETELVKRGLVKGKSVILAPYANTQEELPLQFWERLAKELVKKGYFVFTNICGEEKAIKGSKGLEIPLSQVGNYLEFAGYFISIRSGLCDVAGSSRCKQIVIFRDIKNSFHTSDIEFFDLHEGNISENAIQYLYDNYDYSKNIDMIMSFI